MSKRKTRKKKAKKRAAKSKSIPGPIVKKFVRIVDRLRTVYLDTAILGYKTDYERQKRCGKNLLWFVKKYGRETFISYIDVYEIRPVFQVKKGNEGLKRKILEAAEEFSPKVIGERATRNTLKENKRFFNFLVSLGVSEPDAAHFTVAVFRGIDLFVSFNKRIFVNKKKKIKRRLMGRRIRVPEVWTIDELESLLGEMRKQGF